MANVVFAASMIASLEKKLISDEQFEQMINSGSIDDICRTVQNAGYGSDSEPFTVNNYLDILNRREYHVFDETLELGDDFKVLDLLYFVNDYHNIKVLLKAEAMGVNRDELLLDTGMIPAARMAELVRDRSKAELTDNMYRAVLEGAEVMARTQDPQWVDIVCDRCWGRDMLRVAEEYGNEFILGYVRARIDAANLKAYVRVRKLGEAWPFFSDIILHGGTVDPVIYQKAYAEDLQQFGEHFKGTLMYKAASEGRQILDKTGRIGPFEKMCDDVMLRYAYRGRQYPFGIEHVMAYYVARHNEVANIRILMAGKLIDQKPEIIKERMRISHE